MPPPLENDPGEGEASVPSTAFAFSRSPSRKLAFSPATSRIGSVSSTDVPASAIADADVKAEGGCIEVKRHWGRVYGRRLEGGRTWT